MHNWQNELQDAKTTGSYIFMIFNVNTLIRDSKFINGMSKEGGALYIAGDSNADIQSSLFQNNKARSKGGAIYSTGFLSIKIGNSTQFKDNYAVDQGDDIYLTSSLNLITLNKVLITNMKAKNSIYIEQAKLFSQELTIKDAYQNQNSIRGAGINCQYCSDMGSGGAIYYSCNDQTLNCILSFDGLNIFNQNQAQIKGGAILWTTLEPIFTKINLNFINNTAYQYGDDLACFAQKLGSLSANQFLAQMIKLGLKDSISSRFLQYQTSENIKFNQSVQGQQSGGSIPVIYMGLIDKYGQIVGSDFTSKVRISIQTNNLDEKASKYPPILEGSSDFQTYGGIAVVKDVIVAGSPGCLYHVSFTTDGIDLSKQSNQEAMELLECQDNTYSLVKMIEPNSCEICPSEKAICLGGINIGPQPGYWRKSNTTKNIEKCLFEPACLGMIAPNYNPQGDCLDGYRGILCADCDKGYSRDNNYQCKYCPEHWVNSLRLIAILIGVVLLIVFMVRSTLNGAKDATNVTSIYMKILLNHFQLLLMTSSFDFSWSEQILDFFGATNQVGQVSTQVFSIDCFINSNNDGEQSNSDQKRVFFFKLIIIAVFPLFLTIICFLFWSILNKVRRGDFQIDNKSTASLVILLFLAHPSIVQYSFYDFKCKNIDGELRLQDDLEVICWNSTHTFFSYFVALPSIVVWGIGIPFFALVILFKFRDDLETRRTREKYGFLYRGYKIDYFYWEIVIMYRKIIIIFVSVFIALCVCFNEQKLNKENILNQTQQLNNKFDEQFQKIIKQFQNLLDQGDIKLNEKLITKLTVLLHQFKDLNYLNQMKKGKLNHHQSMDYNRQQYFSYKFLQIDYEIGIDFDEQINTDKKSRTGRKSRTLQINREITNQKFQQQVSMQTSEDESMNLQLGDSSRHLNRWTYHRQNPNLIGALQRFKESNNENKDKVVDSKRSQKMRFAAKSKKYDSLQTVKIISQRSHYKEQSYTSLDKLINMKEDQDKQSDEGKSKKKIPQICIEKDKNHIDHHANQNDKISERGLQDYSSTNAFQNKRFAKDQLKIIVVKKNDRYRKDNGVSSVNDKSKQHKMERNQPLPNNESLSVQSITKLRPKKDSKNNLKAFGFQDLDINFNDKQINLDQQQQLNDEEEDQDQNFLQNQKQINFYQCNQSNSNQDIKKDQNKKNIILKEESLIISSINSDNEQQNNDYQKPLITDQSINIFINNELQQSAIKEDIQKLQSNTLLSNIQNPISLGIVKLNENDQRDQDHSNYKLGLQSTQNLVSPNTCNILQSNSKANYKDQQKVDLNNCSSNNLTNSQKSKDIQDSSSAISLDQEPIIKENSFSYTKDIKKDNNWIQKE
ncbi:UNKNOWN [Stylonychia lemnae]|uniref:Transmembrane protein n=1 Tax=Stylonychia lemnae TaxID=5949 RepID=A0A078A7E9_STYLE|nr:UNKNOWN [Stylonychia lemnae]|eukprot:CDW78175.1 UNKNOWN [Stylonychia lemnae]